MSEPQTTDDLLEIRTFVTGEEIKGVGYLSIVRVLNRRKMRADYDAGKLEGIDPVDMRERYESFEVEHRRAGKLLGTVKYCADLESASTFIQGTKWIRGLLEAQRPKKKRVKKGEG